MANAAFLAQALDGLTASVEQLGKTIHQRDMAIANLQNKLAEKDQLIEKLSADLDAAESLIQEKEDQLSEESDSALNDIAKKIDRLNDAIARLSLPAEAQPIEAPAEVEPVEVEPEVVEEEAIAAEPIE
jgi:chromosome segregation ATPase